MYKVFLSSYSEKFLKKCDKELCNRLLEKIKGLSENPFPSESKRVIGQEKVFRIRVGAYRILYIVFHDKNEVLVSDIDKRSKIYD